ncbi:ABC transporter ATP-binding protein [Desulfosporosinus metallidurans]|uniref:Nucleoside ABC transporter, ATP-binding protein n=1 Tax=Desulfosporosinus metallidurans TaxID=1888891 RepID=A0A1Q8QW01_9FIRM|nr:ABC transporter ATP-binding protein [Desulfosporosinus metallidurans]OLN31513.1 Nucleoside ABC transporter, ATP-binding protein [Desulfosporosinus metallidurans]
MNQSLIQLQGIVKKFPGVLANDHVDLDIYPGEIHAILGENGSGKSTLMSILAGLYRPDEGKILVNGLEQKLRSPRDAIACGIGMIHQHFKLVEPFTVAENITLGEKQSSFILSGKKLKASIHELGKKYGLELNLHAKIWQLSVGEKQRVEIVRMLYRGSKVLVLDEPTAVLTPQETGELFGNLRRMASAGCAVVLITHKLNEVEAVADRVTVLRHGKVAGVLEQSDINAKEMVRLMVGRAVTMQYDKESSPVGQVVLQLDKVNALNDMGLPCLRELSLCVREGEVLGLAGVSGNGQREMAEVISGLRRVESGKVLLNDRNIGNLSPRMIIDLGVAYVPEDRLGMGLVPDLNTLDNLILKNYHQPKYSGRWLLKSRVVQQNAEDLVKQYQVRLASLRQPVKMLSGGNLQKLLLAREISSSPKLMVVIYPARGLDIGATEAVHKLLLELKKRQTAILLISEDLDEIFKLADRVGVVFNGQITGEFPVEQTDLEEVGLLMTGSRSARERINDDEPAHI